MGSDPSLEGNALSALAIRLGLWQYRYMELRTFDGALLRKARQAKNLSQSQLAARISAHVTSISDWERGANEPSGRHVASLSRELGVDAAEFYGDDDDEESASMPLSRGEFALFGTLLAKVVAASQPAQVTR